jgi:hypothetical protein
MKQLELELQKRLLIVEAEEANEFIMSTEIKAGTYRVICKGSELTEELARQLVLGVEDKSDLQSFISAIEANGFTFGENPYTKKPCEGCDNYEVWEEYEKTNFNPEKTLLFEIL